MNKLDRYFLVNQIRILEALYPKEAEDLSVQREALERGYEFIYEMNLDHIYDGDDVMTIEESREVWDTMDMFVSIGVSIERLNCKGFENHSFSKFAGYDGNNETKFMAFASYTVERLKRFTQLPMKEPYYFNSHMPVRDIYKRMLVEFEKIPIMSRMEMNSDQLTSVLKSSNFSDNR